MAVMTRDELKAFIREAGEESARKYQEAIDKVTGRLDTIEGKQTKWFERIAGAPDGPTRAGDPRVWSPGTRSNGDTADRALLTARVIRSLAATKCDVDKALAWNTKHWKDPAVEKALSASEAGAGGVLLPTDLSQDFIELLRPMTVVRRMNPVNIPMPSGSLRLPKLKAGAAASYIGENQAAPKTQPVFGSVNLVFKKLAALIPMSNDLLRYNAVNADAIVRDDTLRAMAQAEDLYFIRGQGTEHSPKGLRYWAPAANLLNATVAGGGNSLADISTDLGRLEQTLKDNNVPMTRPGLIFAPRTERRLKTIQNANGYYTFRDEMLKGTLWGYPFGVTTQIPVNLGSGDKSEIYLADFADAAIGEALSLLIDVSTEAAYDDGSGVLTSAFQNDQTVLRAIQEHDFVMRRDVSVVIITDIAWL